MADQQNDSNTNATLLSLPTEIRLRIYHYIIPSPVLHVNLCSSSDDINPNSATHASPTSPTRRRRSILSNLSRHRHNLEIHLKRTNGIQLLSVCRLLHAEVWPLLEALVVRFHCFKCLRETLHGLSCDEQGFGMKWMKNVEVLLDMPPTSNSGTAVVGTMLAQQTMVMCRNEVRRVYGRLDLAQKERWSFSRVEREGEEEDKNYGGDGGGVGMGTAASNAQQPSNTAASEQNRTRWLIKGWFDPEWSLSFTSRSDGYLPQI